MWLNGMMNLSNLFVNGRFDDNLEEIIFYGEDLEGQVFFEESDNNVEVFFVQLLNVSNGELIVYLCNFIDFL